MDQAATGAGLAAKVEVDRRDISHGAHLMGVPPEILWDITSHLLSCDLASLVRVNKKAYEVCIPRLYETIEFGPVNSRNPTSLLKHGSSNLRYVRSIKVVDAEEAGLWHVSSPKEIQQLSHELSKPLNEFLRHLENGSLREFTWRTAMRLEKSTADYILKCQQNIQSLSLRHLDFSLNPDAAPDDGTPHYSDFCATLLDQQQLVRLDIESVNGFTELEHLAKAVIKHRRTLKHIRFGFPGYTSGKKSYISADNNNWGRKAIQEVIVASGIHLDSAEKITFGVLRSLELTDFEFSAEDVQEAGPLLKGIIQLRQLQSLKLRNCGYLDSIVWPLITPPSQISVLHLTVNFNHTAVYKFLERQGVSTTLIELRLVIRVKREIKFPDVRRHAKTLRILYLAMITTHRQLYGATGDSYGVFFMHDTPMSLIYQLMSLPRLEQLAITLPTPSISPVKLEKISFPSLRLLWILRADDLIEPQQFRSSNNFFNLIRLPLQTPLDEQPIGLQRHKIDKIFGYPEALPSKLEMIGLGLTLNRKYPTTIVLIQKALPNGPKSIPEAEILDFDGVLKIITASEPNYIREESSCIKAFELEKGLFGTPGW